MILLRDVDDRVEMLELDARLGGGEAPLHGGVGAVPWRFPACDLADQRVRVGDALVQALAAEHAELDLSEPILLHFL